MKYGSCRAAARRGAAAALAMMYLVIFTSLTAAMFAMSSINVQVADNLADVARARAAAESGMRWMQYRFLKMNRPRTAVGNITPAVAASLWPAIRTAIADDLAGMLDPAERPVTLVGNTLKTSLIATGDSNAKFAISITPDDSDARRLRVVSTGTCGAATRSVSMYFLIDKKVKFAIAGKVPIQLGRNVVVEGPVATVTTTKYPPLFSLSDFRSLTASLRAKVDAFQSFCETRHVGYDNRIDVRNTEECAAAQAAGYYDANGDGYIDEYDLFLREFDADGDGAVTREEFTDPTTGRLYDAELFNAIDSLGGPLFEGDVVRVGYQDGRIDNNDGYAKIRGQILLATTEAAWKSKLPSGQTIQDQIKGPISPSVDGAPPVKFAITPADVFDLSPANFDTSSFRARTGPENGPTVRTPTLIENAVLSAADANGGTVDERTPYGSTSYQATYRRPVFRNMTFRNCRIPKGLNALFDNCVFEGVTFVELETNVTNSSGQTTTNPNDGMTYSKRMKSGSFSASTVLTSSNSWGYVLGNNLRFNDCTIRGPLAASVRTAYTHFSDSWEFTGATYFDNRVDQTATIVAPQTNIEMGSFTDPAAAPSTLVGVVVAGNIDIRGSGLVDGSIIVTGDGAGNTTMGWFGPSDSSTDPSSPMPEGGWGKLNIRYNPYRALPDGINVAIDILPDVSTYTEGS